VNIDELTQPGLGNGAEYCCEGDIKNWMTELKLSAVEEPQTDSTAATASPTSFGELFPALDIIPRY
jgi:hypothetical protein